MISRTNVNTGIKLGRFRETLDHPDPGRPKLFESTRDHFPGFVKTWVDSKTLKQGQSYGDPSDPANYWGHLGITKYIDLESIINKVNIN